MKYCIKTFDGKSEHTTKDNFWRLVSQECMFGSQSSIDNMERCLYIGQKFNGSKHIFWFEDISPSDVQKAKTGFEELWKKLANDPARKQAMDEWTKYINEAKANKETRK